MLVLSYDIPSGILSWSIDVPEFWKLLNIYLCHVQKMDSRQVEHVSSEMWGQHDFHSASNTPVIESYHNCLIWSHTHTHPKNGFTTRFFASAPRGAAVKSSAKHPPDGAFCEDLPMYIIEKYKNRPIWQCWSQEHL